MLVVLDGPAALPLLLALVELLLHVVELGLCLVGQFLGLVHEAHAVLLSRGTCHIFPLK